MSEKSGIEMLEEILRRLDFIEKRLNVMDQNIKAVANSARIADLVNKASGTSLDGWARANKPAVPEIKKEVDVVKKDLASGFKNFSFEPTDAAKMNRPPVSKRGDKSAPVVQKPKSILVTGKLKIDSGDGIVPLAGASVKIYDDQDKVVKSTKTNRAGHWMSHLSPGRYVALFEGEINGKKLLPQNKNFEVPDNLPKGQKEFEVM